MDPINILVAKNIKKLRETHKLSLEELAKHSGVSKSMLAQIERGEGNPTISTLWKISNGLQVPFDALTLRPKVPYEIVKISELEPLLEDEGRVKNYALFPDDDNRRFAVYYLELAESAYWQSDAHLKGTTEFITLFAGRMAIDSAGEQFVLNKGESIRFRADTRHSYRNIGQETVVMQMILFNP